MRSTISDSSGMSSISRTLSSSRISWRSAASTLGSSAKPVAAAGSLTRRGPQRLARAQRRGASARRGRAPPSGAPARRHGRPPESARPATCSGKSVRCTLSVASASTVVTRFSQIASATCGMIGAMQSRQRREHLVEGRVGGALVGVELTLPEPTPVAAHVPVREVVDERLDGTRGAHRVVAIERDPRLGNQRVEARQDPSVKERSRLGHAVDLVRRPAVQAGVRDEEAVGVPERQEESAHHLVAGPVAEAEVDRGIGGRVHPAHHVRADALRGLVERDRVALALVHLLAVLVEERARSRRARASGPRRSSPSTRSAARRTSCGTGRGTTR